MAEELSRTLTPPDGTVQGLVEVPKVRDPTAFYWVSIWFPAWKRLTRPLSCLPIRFYYDAGFSHLNELSLGGLSEVNMDVMTGRPGSDKELAAIVGQVRRRLSVAAIRANSTCLLSRLSLIGEEATSAADRRGWRRREEDIMRKEREAQWLGQVRCHGVQHRGEFCLL